MSNSHLFPNRHRNGQLARKATTATPLEVQTRILQVVLRYTTIRTFRPVTFSLPLVTSLALLVTSIHKTVS